MSKFTDNLSDDAHFCDRQGCVAIVPYDDEPYCFEHSFDSGSTVPGYSHKKSQEKK